MLRSLLIVISLSALLSANVSQYTVRLGVYQNHKSLMEMVNKFSPALKKTVVFFKRGDATAAVTLPTENRAILQKLLPVYRKVFDDAYIAPITLSEKKKR